MPFPEKEGKMPSSCRAQSGSLPVAVNTIFFYYSIASLESLELQA